MEATPEQIEAEFARQVRLCSGVGYGRLFEIVAQEQAADPHGTEPGAKCRGCGKPMIWAKTETGSTIPLDAKAPVYDVKMADEEAVAIRLEHAHVSHFATCPKAAQFAGKGKSA
jgi:hypothetical protein